MATTSDYLTQLQQDREDLVDNLETKGITGLVGNETFTQLVPQVLNISGGSSIDWSQIGYNEEPSSIQNGYDYALEIKNNWVSTTNYSNKFSGNKKIYYMPLVNTSTGTNFAGFFNNCSSLQSVPLLDISNATDISGFFNNCSALKSVPQFNTANIASFFNFYGNCSSLEDVPELNLSKANAINQMFNNCTSLKNLGGFLNLGQSYLTTKPANTTAYALDLSFCSNITHTSLLNIINNLYDIATKGCNAQTVYLSSACLSSLTAEEIAIATNKGWNIS